MSRPVGATLSQEAAWPDPRREGIGAPVSILTTRKADLSTDREPPQSESAALPLGDADRAQILALDGGGAKALFTAHVLAWIEKDLGVRIADAFDLIAGTSAGGIIALGLGAGLRPAEIVDHYTQLTHRVFPRSRQARWRLVPRAVAPAYSGRALKDALTGVLGDLLLGHSTKRLLIPSWDVERGEVHIFKTPHHVRLRRDWRVPMVDVALATTAAPSYFPAAIVNDQRLVDGGVWANNPSVLGIGEAVSMLGAPLGSIRVLNIGAVNQRAVHPRRLDTGGWANWATHAAALMITATGRGTQRTAAHLIGTDKFVRFDATVPGDVFTLDRADPKTLAGLAAGESRRLSPLYTAVFAEHTAGPYVPLRRPGAAAADPADQQEPS